MSIRSQFSINASVVASNDVDLGAARAARTIATALVLTDGADAGEADRVFADTRTLAASATEDLDLAGALTDAFGVAQVFARVKALVVKADPANTNDVLVSRGANGLTMLGASGDLLRVRPGCTLALVCGVADAVGYPVTAGTGDLLTVANSAAGTPVTYSVLVIGASA